MRRPHPSLAQKLLLFLSLYVQYYRIPSCSAAPERVCKHCRSADIILGLADPKGLWKAFLCSACGKSYSDAIRLRARCSECKIMGIFGVKGSGRGRGCLHCK
jgi:hypothetical protein